MDEIVGEGFENVSHQTALERITRMADEAEIHGNNLFMPDFNPLQMHYREEIIGLLEAKGWVLEHWSVTGQPPFVCAYPVFRKSSH